MGRECSIYRPQTVFPQRKVNIKSITQQKVSFCFWSHLSVVAAAHLDTLDWWSSRPHRPACVIINNISIPSCAPQWHSTLLFYADLFTWLSNERKRCLARKSMWTSFVNSRNVIPPECPLNIVRPTHANKNCKHERITCIIIKKTNRPVSVLLLLMENRKTLVCERGCCVVVVRRDAFSRSPSART